MTLTAQQALRADFYEVAEQAATKVLEEEVDLDEAFVDAQVQLEERAEEYGADLTEEMKIRELYAEIYDQVMGED